MIHDDARIPVSPHASTPTTPGGGDGASAPGTTADETVNFDHVLHGQEKTQTQSHEPVALPSPKPMTAEQKAKHDLTHMPPDPGCHICKSTRTPNLGHRATNEAQRTIPLLVGDYCFLKTFTEKILATCLVMRLYHYRIFFSTIVPKKGYHADVIARVARFIKEMGLVHFAYRCDREASLNLLVEEAIARTGRTGKRVYTDDPDDDSDEPNPQDKDPDTSTAAPTLIAVPELTHPGESASNGLAERSIRSIEEQTRTFLAATEARIRIPIPSDHPLLGWIVEHATYVLNHFLVGPDGQTPYSRLHGKNSSKKLCEFGEKLLWFVPKRLRSKLDSPWRYGVFLGVSMCSDQYFIGTHGGDVVRARAILRLIPDKRWDAERLMAVRTTPLTESTRYFDSLESKTDPHEFPAEDRQPDLGHDPTRRRVKITLKDLQTYGYSPHCPKCALHRDGQHRRARFHGHTEQCRQRLYDLMSDAGENKIVNADADRKKTTAHRPDSSMTSPTPTPETPNVHKPLGGGAARGFVRLRLRRGRD